MRTIRLCEGDNVTSFVMPPISQKPIPISFVKAPKDMTRFGNTQPTWLIINVSKITLTDHPLFVTEDYICARLHKVYMNYLTIMRKDHLTYITSKILNLLNNIKIKKNEVIEFGLMEQRQGKHLINLTLELIDYCSQFVEEKEHITNITTNVYRVWKDLKNVRRNAGIISTSTSLYVKKCQRNQEEVAVITRLDEVVDTM